MTERLSPERLAEFRSECTGWAECGLGLIDNREELLAHLDAQQAEIDRLVGQVAALREALAEAITKDWDRCDPTKERMLLAYTGAAGRAHDRRMRQEGGKQFAGFLHDRSDQVGRRYAISELEYWLADMEREA